MNYRRLNAAFFLIVLFLSSCVDARFKEPQPANKRERNTFPKAMQGTFLSTDGDTILINDYSFWSQKDMFKKDNRLVMHIGDSLKIKRFYGSVFVNILNDNNYWNVVLLDYANKDYLHVYYIDPEAANVKELEKIAQLEVVRNEKGKKDFVLLNPSKREWKQIIKQEIPELIQTYRRI